MTAGSSIDPAEFLHEHLAQASPDLLRELMQGFINTLLSADADSVCGASFGVRDPERTNRRNGYRHRDLDTRVGTLDVAVPKLREGSYFPDWLLERRRRAEAALTSVVATCYLLGVSTRRMDRLVQSLGITGLSRSQVSVMARDLDQLVADFRERPLDAGPYTFVAADALTMKVREGGRVIKIAVMVATGVNADGFREILGVATSTVESGAGWNSFFKDLVARGLSGVELVTSDAHTGLVDAVGANLPGASWQRCRTHYTANLMSVCPKHAWGGVKAMLHSVFDQIDADAVRHQYDKLLDQIETSLPEVHAHLDAARAEVLAFTAFPPGSVAPDLVQQPQRAAQPRDPTPHRRGRHLPRPRLHHPARRRRARRAERRMGRRPPLPRTRRPRQEQAHPDHHQRGGQHHSRRDQRLTINDESPSYTTTRDLTPGGAPQVVGPGVASRHERGPG
jgi:putative transposase